MGLNVWLAFQFHFQWIDLIRHSLMLELQINKLCLLLCYLGRRYTIDICVVIGIGIDVGTSFFRIESECVFMQHGWTRQWLRGVVVFATELNNLWLQIWWSAHVLQKRWLLESIVSYPFVDPIDFCLIPVFLTSKNRIVPLLLRRLLLTIFILLVLFVIFIRLEKWLAIFTKFIAYLFF